MSLSRKTMEHPVLILIVFALLGMLGIFTFSKIAIALFPEVENPYLPNPDISKVRPNNNGFSFGKEERFKNFNFLQS